MIKPFAVSKTLIMSDSTIEVEKKEMNYVLFGHFSTLHSHSLARNSVQKCTAKLTPNRGGNF